MLSRERKSESDFKSRVVLLWNNVLMCRWQIEPGTWISNCIWIKPWGVINNQFSNSNGGLAKYDMGSSKFSHQWVSEYLLN